VTSPAPADRWAAVLASAPRALPTQTPAWLDCVCRVDGYEDASRLYETADGRTLVLPLVRRRAVPHSLASLPPGWGPAGLLGEGGEVRSEDVRLVFADLAAQRAGIALRPDPATAAAWERGMPPRLPRRPLMAQTLDLTGGFEDVWRARFRGAARNRVRRAERAGVQVEWNDTGEFVPAFQELYARSVERWARRDGQPVALARWRAGRREPERKLGTVAAVLGPRCRVYLASVDTRPVAGIVVLHGRRTAAYWRGAMDAEAAGRTYATYLLHRMAIADAVAAGCTAYHLGDSAPGSPLALFKSRFGAVEQHYAGYQVNRPPLLEAAANTGRRVGATLYRRRERR
jgi:hypothetical protein